MFNERTSNPDDLQKNININNYYYSRIKGWIVILFLEVVSCGIEDCINFIK